MCTAENFDVDTWESFDGKTETVEYCAAEVGCILMNPNDLWQHKLDARVKTLAASTGKLQRLPHEEWLFGKEGPIEGCPSTVEVEASLIYDAVNARDDLLQVIASSNFMSAQKLKKLVQTHQETLRKSDKSWWLEEEFLLGGAYDKAINAHLKSCLVAILPEDGQEFSIAKGVMAMRQLISGEVVVVQDIVLQKELQALQI